MSVLTENCERYFGGGSILVPEMGVSSGISSINSSCDGCARFTRGIIRSIASVLTDWTNRFIAFVLDDIIADGLCFISKLLHNLWVIIASPFYYLIDKIHRFDECIHRNGIIGFIFDIFWFPFWLFYIINYRLYCFLKEVLYINPVRIFNQIRNSFYHIICCIPLIGHWLADHPIILGIAIATAILVPIFITLMIITNILTGIIAWLTGTFSGFVAGLILGLIIGAIGTILGFLFGLMAFIPGAIIGAIIGGFVGFWTGFAIGGLLGLLSSGIITSLVALHLLFKYTIGLLISFGLTTLFGLGVLYFGFEIILVLFIVAPGVIFLVLTSLIGSALFTLVPVIGWIFGPILLLIWGIAAVVAMGFVTVYMIIFIPLLLFFIALIFIVWIVWGIFGV